jgi:CheY-like chemotaxis protein
MPTVILRLAGVYTHDCHVPSLGPRTSFPTRSIAASNRSLNRSWWSWQTITTSRMSLPICSDGVFEVSAAWVVIVLPHIAQPTSERAISPTFCRRQLRLRAAVHRLACKAYMVLKSLVDCPMDGVRPNLRLCGWVSDRGTVENVDSSRSGRIRVSDAQAMPSSAHADKTTILVVDDEVIVRAFISDVLRDQGYTVIEAVKADEALAVLRSPLKVDLVLTDMRMPGTMDGASLARLVRAELPFVKVAMVAGQSPDEELREVLDGFLQKPVTPTQLRSFLLTILPKQVHGDSP